ncbi:hypothetical protein KIPB_012677, partial [Kipferlia bialata]
IAAQTEFSDILDRIAAEAGAHMTDEGNQPIRPPVLSLGSIEARSRACHSLLSDMVIQLRPRHLSIAIQLGEAIDAMWELFGEYAQMSARTVSSLDRESVQMAERCQKAETETMQMLRAAQLLEKEVTAHAANRQEAESAFVADRDRMIEEVGALRADNERLQAQIRQMELGGSMRTTSRQSQGPSHSKSRVSRYAASPEPKQRASRVATPSSLSSTRKAPSRKGGKQLSLKQLKDFISELYESKTKYDKKCHESHIPRETLEQHLFTHLNQKYGLKSLIVDWADAVIAATKRFEKSDNDVAVFARILRNEIDEEFRFIQKQ